jgi:hypothetical protein
MKITVFWDVTLFGFYNNRRFGGMKHPHHQSDINRRARNNVSSN